MLKSLKDMSLQPRVALVVLLLLATHSVSGSVLAQADITPPAIDYSQVVAGLDMQAVEEHIEYLSGLGTRMTGYPECDSAATYIYNYLSSLPSLENITIHSYNVVVPASFGPYGANLTIIDPEQRTIKIHAMMPNSVALVNTGGKHLKGPLIYAGGGELSDLDGKIVEDSIVLMDFNSRQRWLQIADLGAKAVIFIEPITTTRTEADMKYLMYAPAAFPRFYVDAEGGVELMRLAKSGVTVEVYSNQQWLTVPAHNVWAFLKGTGNPDKTIILAASFDTQGVVPTVSPGASEACSVAALLELAKYFSENKPKTSLLFAAFSGSKRWGAGVREWVEKYFYHEWFNEERNERTPFIDTLFLGIEIDLMPDNSFVYPSTTGKLLGTHFLHNQWVPFQRYYWGEMTRAIQDQLKKEFRHSDHWPEVFTGPLTGYELEPVYLAGRNYQAWVNAGLPGFTLTTVQSWRVLLDTPLDTYTNFPSTDGLRTQLEFVYSALSTIANDRNLPDSDLLPRNQRFPVPIGAYGQRVGDGFVIAEGKVVTWNTSIGFYTPVPNALVYVAGTGVSRMTEYNTYFGTTPHLIVRTDENGTFRIPGYTVRPNLGHHAVNGYVVNSTGHILYAPDYGRYRTVDSMEEPMTTAERTLSFGTWAVFECGAITIFKMQLPNLDRIAETAAPRDATDLLPSVRARYLISQSEVHTPLDHYSVIEENMGPGHTVSVIFVTPNEPVEVIYGGSVRRLLLLNSTQDKPTGLGYYVNKGGNLPIKNLVLTSLENTYLLNEDRTSTLIERGISPTMVELHQKAGSSIALAKRALSPEGGYSYTAAYNHSVYAQALEQKYWLETGNTIKGTAHTIVYFAALLIPFAFLAEGIFVRAGGYRRVVALALLYLVTLVFFSLVHPSFNVAVNPAMVLVGFATILFIAPLFIIVYNRSGDVLKEIRTEKLGLHFPEAVRFSAFMESLTVGVENLRKRRLRTALTLSAITIMCLSIVLFSSVQPIQVFRPKEQAQVISVIPYKGIFIKLPEWDEFEYKGGVGEPAVEWLRIRYGDEATVAPRAWLYTSSHPSFPDGKFMLTSRDGAGEARVSAILGATPAEKEVRHIEATLSPGSVWFSPGLEYVALLSNNTAQKLGVQPGDQVNLMGIKLLVVGVFGPELMGLLELDQEPITPVNSYISNMNQQWEPATHHWVDDVIIMPYETVLSLSQRPAALCGFWDYIASVTIVFEDESRILEVAQDISNVLRASFLTGTYKGMYVFASTEVNGEEKIYQVSLVDLQTIGGLESQIVLLVLVYLICLNLLLASVHERVREMATYSSLGVSPSQIGFMFITESAVYAVIGSVLGYMAAIAILKLLAPPGIAPNFASVWVTITVSASILVTLGASLYPAFKASRIVTPSLERRFRIATQPIEDEWEIPLPFSTTEKGEAQGILAFLAEYVMGHLGVTVAAAADVFSADRLWYAEGGEAKERYHSVRMTARLAPFDRNVSQEAHFTTSQGPDGRYNFTLYLRRKAGTRKDWERINYAFVDAIRKQFLVWRALAPSKRQKYVSTAAQRLIEIKGSIDE